jgi:hypothetical protein
MDAGPGRNETDIGEARAVDDVGPADMHVGDVEEPAVQRHADLLGHAMLR